MTTKYRNDLNVLAWYGNRNMQLHRRYYSQSYIYPLCTPVGKIMPFQIILPKKNNRVIKAELFSIDDNRVADITKQLMLNVIMHKESNCDIFVNAGFFTMLGEYNEGSYYIALSDDSDKYYSEVFTFGDVSCMVKIEYSNQHSLTDIHGNIQVYYGDMYTNIIYLDMGIGRPEYTFIEEGEERDGKFVPTYQISQKKFIAKVRLPEHIIDAIRIVPLHDFITITDGRSGIEYNVEHISMDVKWGTSYLANVSIEFMENTEVKKVGGLIESIGDFNNDFNNDFNIKDNG